MMDLLINAAKEVFGKRIQVVADRFHVAKLYRKGLESLRKQELKRLRGELSEEEYKELEGVMWVLRKKGEDLSTEDKPLLEKLFEHSPVLEIAYGLQNDLTDIFDIELSRSGGKRRIKNWMRRVEESGIVCYKKFLSTLDSYLEEIANYFIHRDSSEFVEGLNNKIKVIKRRCYGILSVDHLFHKIFLDISGRKVFDL